MKSVLMISTAVMFLVASGAWAQEENCLEYRAMAQFKFDVGVRSYVGTWYAFLGDELLIDSYTGSRVIVPPIRTCNDIMCQERDGVSRLDFGDGNTLTVKLHTAVFPTTVRNVFGQYRATRRIVSGTGRFQNATGLIVESGPFILWRDSTGVNARYSAEASGTICGVAPK